MIKIKGKDLKLISTLAITTQKYNPVYELLEIKGIGNKLRFASTNGSEISYYYVETQNDISGFSTYFHIDKMKELIPSIPDDADVSLDETSFSVNNFSVKGGVDSKYVNLDSFIDLVPKGTPLFTLPSDDILKISDAFQFSNKEFYTKMDNVRIFDGVACATDSLSGFIANLSINESVVISANLVNIFNRFDINSTTVTFSKIKEEADRFIYHFSIGDLNVIFIEKTSEIPDMTSPEYREAYDLDFKISVDLDSLITNLKRLNIFTNKEKMFKCDFSVDLNSNLVKVESVEDVYAVDFSLPFEVVQNLNNESYASLMLNTNLLIKLLSVMMDYVDSTNGEKVILSVPVKEEQNLMGITSSSGEVTGIILKIV